MVYVFLLGCDRSVFKEIQLCLALLYSLLSQYSLREAQELGDHMARLILHRDGRQSCITGERWTIILQSFKGYFTSESVYVLEL